MSEERIPVDTAARIMGVPSEEAANLANGEGVPVEKVREQASGATAKLMLELARELSQARETLGQLEGRLEEVRASNLRMQKEVREGIKERRRLTEEVLELRAAAEERLMLMERIEHISHIEWDLAEAEREIERLRNRGLLSRLRNRGLLSRLRNR